MVEMFIISVTYKCDLCNKVWETTLNVIFSVTYYLKLCNAYFMSHFLQTNVKVVVWTSQNNIFTW